MPRTMVTIIVPTFNKAKFIVQTLNSIRSQTYQNWELLIIDDHSTDETASIVKKHINLKKEKLIVRKKNEGICHVMNEALQNIRSKYFIQVDGDDWISPGALEILVKRMEKEPSTTALAYANCTHWHYKKGEDHFHKVVKAK